jgi:hypothetical protein
LAFSTCAPFDFDAFVHLRLAGCLGQGFGLSNRARGYARSLNWSQASANDLAHGGTWQNVAGRNRLCKILRKIWKKFRKKNVSGGNFWTDFGRRGQAAGLNFGGKNWKNFRKIFKILKNF